MSNDLNYSVLNVSFIFYLPIYNYNKVNILTKKITSHVTFLISSLHTFSWHHFYSSVLLLCKV